MVRIDFLILGYRKLKLSPEKLGEAASILLRAKISSEISNEGNIIVRERDFPRIKTLFDKRIEYQACEPCGAYGIYKRTKNKKAIFSALLISLLFLLVSSSLVWDIRVEGNENVPDAKIIEELEESGFSVGDIFGLANRSEIEHVFLKNNPEISWININRRGTVAYITVIENNNIHEEQEPSHIGYSNVVAACDSVIEEITVKKGYAMVKAGDSVKKGDILISGVIPTEGGPELCYAEGSVIGRQRDEIIAELPREYTEKVLKEEVCSSMNIKLFDFSVNIFKKYGNHYSGCDIIKEVKSFSLLGKCKLPFEIHEEKAVVYEDRVCSYTDTQLVSAVSRLLSAKTAAFLSSSDLLKIKTTGEFTEDGYRMKSYVVFSSEIGEDLPFKAE